MTSEDDDSVKGKEVETNQCTDLVPYEDNLRNTITEGNRKSRNTKRGPPASSSTWRTRQPAHKDIVISGSEFVHFGNTYVSYGFVNVPTGQPNRRTRHSDNIFDYLNQDDDPRFAGRNRTQVTFNRSRTDRDFLSSFPAASINQKRGAKDEKIKKKFLVSYGVLVFIVIFLLVLFFYLKNNTNEQNKDNSVQKMYVPKTENVDKNLKIERLFGLKVDCDDRRNGTRPRNRLRFVIRKSLLFYCRYSGEDCNYELGDEVKLHTRNSFKDIYYNYIIDSNGKISKGRDVNRCEFSEEFLHGHENLVTVGIGYCFDDDNTDASIKKSNTELEAMKKLVPILVKEGILSEDFRLEFLNECQNGEFIEKVSREFSGRLSFYDFSTYTGDPQKSSTQQMQPIINISYVPGEKPITNTQGIITPKIRFIRGEAKGSCNEDCNTLSQRVESHSGRIAYNYFVFLNGSYCEKSHPTDSAVNIALLDMYDFTIVNKQESYRSFMASMFKLANEIKEIYSLRKLHSYICRNSIIDRFDSYESYIALAFNAKSERKPKKEHSHRDYDDSLFNPYGIRYRYPMMNDARPREPYDANSDCFDSDGNIKMKYNN